MLLNFKLYGRKRAKHYCRTLFDYNNDVNIKSLLQQDPLDVTDQFEADVHTYFGVVREFSTMFLGTFYQTNPLLRQITAPTNALYLAVFFAAVTGAGSSYTHYELDRQHQAGSGKKAINNNSYSLARSSPLSYIQLSMLTITAIALANDAVGFFSYLLGLAAAGSIENPYLIAISITLFFFGLIAAWAEVRACKIAMQINNGSLLPAADDPNQKADGWSKFSIFMKAIQIASTSGLFWAKVSDQLFGFDKVTPVQVSVNGLLAATLPTLFITSCVAFYQYYINVNNQGHYNHSIISRASEESHSRRPSYISSFTDAEQNSSCFLYVSHWREFFLIGRLLGSAGEFAAELVFLIPAALAPKWFLPILLFCLVVGVLISISDARTAWNNLEHYLEKNPPTNTPSESNSRIDSPKWQFFCCCNTPEETNSSDSISLTGSSQLSGDVESQHNLTAYWSARQQL